MVNLERFLYYEWLYSSKMNGCRHLGVGLEQGKLLVRLFLKLAAEMRKGLESKVNINTQISAKFPNNQLPFPLKLPSCTSKFTE